MVAHTFNLTSHCSRRNIIYSENLPQKEREGAGKKSQLVKFLPHKYEGQSWIPRNLTKSQVGEKKKAREACSPLKSQHTEIVAPWNKLARLIKIKSSRFNNWPSFSI